MSLVHLGEQAFRTDSRDIVFHESVLRLFCAVQFAIVLESETLGYLYGILDQLFPMGKQFNGSQGNGILKALGCLLNYRT
jgi:hypothetical protein